MGGDGGVSNWYVDEIQMSYQLIALRPLSIHTPPHPPHQTFLTQRQLISLDGACSSLAVTPSKSSGTDPAKSQMSFTPQDPVNSVRATIRSCLGDARCQSRCLKGTSRGEGGCGGCCVASGGLCACLVVVQILLVGALCVPC